MMAHTWRSSAYAVAKIMPTAARVALQAREIREALRERGDDVRRIVAARVTRGAREAREAERLVVAAGAVGVDLARVKVAVLAEREVDAHERGLVARERGRLGEALRRRGQVVAARARSRSAWARAAASETARMTDSDADTARSWSSRERTIGWRSTRRWPATNASHTR